MTDRPQTSGDDSRDAVTDGLGRRRFVALGAGASVTALAGCSGESGLVPGDGGDSSDGSDGSNTLTGSFRLLVSDAPADIGDFDRLDVTLEEARIFEAEGGDGEDEEAAENEEDDDQTGGDGETADDAQEGNESDPQNETVSGADGEDGEGGEDEDDDENGDDGSAGGENGDDENAGGEDGDRGFTVIDLDGSTVDLTQVIGDDAVAVFEGEIPAGSYEKIEVDVSETEGVVDGETAEVKLPSEKLQITNGFEVTPEEPVSFVFDINVVKRGRNNGYILTPVISGSGVAGRDVEVNEVDDDSGDEGDGENDGDDGGGNDNGGDGGGPGGNETEPGDGDDAENGTATENGS